MKVCLLSILISCTLVEYSEPYPPSGYKPSGPIFELPKRLENVHITTQRPHTKYGVPFNRQYDPNYNININNDNNNEYSYKTINLQPSNQYGTPQNQVPHSSYNTPKSLITQQQLPKYHTNEFRNTNNLQRHYNEYGLPNFNRNNNNNNDNDNNNNNNVDIVRSVDISSEVNYNLNNRQPQQPNDSNFHTQFKNQYDDNDGNENADDNVNNRFNNNDDDNNNQPNNFYNSPDNNNNNNNNNVEVTTPEVDIRSGSNDDRNDVFNNIPVNGNDFNNDDESGNGFGSDSGRDGYYNDNPTVQPEDEPTTTTTTTEIPPYNSNDYDNNFDTSQIDGNVAISNSFAGGQYYVLQPNGHLQRVTFNTMPNDKNERNGFTANLVYENVEPIRDPIYTYDDNLYLTPLSK